MSFFNTVHPAARAGGRGRGARRARTPHPAHERGHGPSTAPPDAPERARAHETTRGPSAPCDSHTDTEREERELSQTADHLETVSRGICVRDRVVYV